VNESEARPTRGAARASYSARDLIRVPGLLSLARLPMAALFPFVFRNPAHAIGLLAAAALTDVADGWYARRFRQQTSTGAVVDGVMDKLFALSVLLTLVLSGSLSVLDALVLSAREVGEALLVAVALAIQPRPPPRARSANAMGKLATTLQFVSVVLVLLRRGPRALLIYAAGGSGAVAAITYGIREFAAPRALP
jgi:cardiolipin synthase (CMP-forming)